MLFLFQYMSFPLMHNARENGISRPSCQLPFWRSTAPSKLSKSSNLPLTDASTIARPKHLHVNRHIQKKLA